MKVDGASLFKTDGDMVYATKQNTVEKQSKIHALTSRSRPQLQHRPNNSADPTTAACARIDLIPC